MYGEFSEISYSILILYFYLHLHFTSSLMIPDFYKSILCTFVVFSMAATFTANLIPNPLLFVQIKANACGVTK